MAKTPAARGPRRKPRAKKGGPNAIDVHVGTRMRMRRLLLGLSQEKLGDALGLTFQQVQKYERGVNRIGAGRLFALAQALEVPVTFFYEDLPAGTGARRNRALAESAAALEGEPMSNRETIELVRAYYRVGDPRKRRKVLELIRSMGREE